MPSKDWKGVSGLAKGSFAKGSSERVVLPPLVINTCIDLVVAGDKLFLGNSPDWIQGYMYTLGRQGLRVSNSPVSS